MSKKNNKDMELKFEKIIGAAWYGTLGYFVGKLVEAIGGWPGMVDVAFLALGALYGFFSS